MPGHPDAGKTELARALEEARGTDSPILIQVTGVYLVQQLPWLIEDFRTPVPGRFAGWFGNRLVVVYPNGIVRSFGLFKGGFMLDSSWPTKADRLMAYLLTGWPW